MGEEMKDLSVIIPFCREFPQVVFTIQSIAQELKRFCDFEIIAVNNYCDEAKRQNYTCQACGASHPEFLDDKGGEAVKASIRVNQPWLKYAEHRNKLSHWQAKNTGVKASEGEVLWFCDAHCIVGREIVRTMFTHFIHGGYYQKGSMHLPLTYKILESHRTMYKPVLNIEKGEYAYSLTGYKKIATPAFPVPAASTCGMMITRELYDEVGGWPIDLGIYGGGENFMNFTLAVLGYEKYMLAHDKALHHHGDKRGYHYVYDDYIYNKILATYMFGGKAVAELFAVNAKGRPEVLKQMVKRAFKSVRHRNLIKEKQVRTIQDWAEEWNNERWPAMMK